MDQLHGVFLSLREPGSRSPLMTNEQPETPDPGPQTPACPPSQSGTTSLGIQGQISSTSGWLTTVSPVTSCLTQLSVNTSPPGASRIRQLRPWTNRRAGGNGLPATPKHRPCVHTVPGGWGGSAGSRLGRRRPTQQGWKRPLVPATRLSPSVTGNSQSAPHPTRPARSNACLEKAAAPPTPLTLTLSQAPITMGKFSFKRES